MPPNQPGSLEAFEMNWTAEIMPATAARVRRKKYENSLTDPIQTIFGLSDPNMVSQTEAEKFLAHHPHLRSSENFVLAAPKTQVGIEVEVENVLKIDPNVGILFWLIKEDHSLRNYGREFVTPGVIPVSLAESALKQLFGGLNSDIDFSNRTSIHVHLDMRQLTLQQIVAFLLSYTTVENLLFKFVGNSRRTNIFCVPLSETGLMESMGVSTNRFVYAIDNVWQKYTALNLLPLTSQGSVEFRHMPGTANLQQILVWLELICRLKLFVYRNSFESIVDRIMGLNSNSMYRHFVEEIFGNLTGYLDLSNLKLDMEKPVYLAKNCSSANAFDKMVRETSKQDSQLIKHVGTWLTALSEDQKTALFDIAKGLGKDSDDLESLFRDIVNKSSAYIRAYPSLESSIRILLKIAPKKAPKTLQSFTATF
jgi:hypothetical protein